MESNINDEEIGKIFKITSTREQLNAIGIYEDQEIVNMQGQLLIQYPNGHCMLSIKMKYIIDGKEIIHDTQLSISKHQLLLIDNDEQRQ